MRYVSTRGGMPPKPFCEILLEGLAPDGGLTIPENFPKIGAAELGAWCSLDYRALAFEILSRYIDDIAAADLRAILERTYTARTFRSEDITPVLQLEPRLHILQL